MVPCQAIPANPRRTPGDSSSQWTDLQEGLDGIAIDLPAMNLKPTHSGYCAFNIRIAGPTQANQGLAGFFVFRAPTGGPYCLV